VSGRRALRAPAEDGAVAAAPPLEEVGRLLAVNGDRLRRGGPPLLGRPWADLRPAARRAAVAAARRYLGSDGEPVPDFGDAPLVMAGHQPELFHPGVWVKNFALTGLARRHGLTPLNLVVDNDTVKSVALRVPARAAVESPHPHAVAAPFDRWAGEAPYEGRAVEDAALFDDFADRVTGLLRGWDYRPMLPEFWAEVRRQAGRTPLLGERFAAARRTFERRWGCHNLEVPVSLLCETEPFAWFACHLLAELPRFHAAYNAAVHDYRRRYGIKSRNHPAPDLAADGDWLEAPLWGWRAGQARRGRLFARIRGGRVELRDGGDEWPALPAHDPEAAWAELRRRGLKVRSRALTNTLFARLFLCDLFLHGIGGGKYDEVTDDLIRRFYACEPPEYLVLTATLLLPLPAPPVTADDCRRLSHELRDLHWNPQRHLADGGAPAARKREWVARRPADAAGRRERFRVLRELTAELRRPLVERERQLRTESEACGRALEANAVLRRRDYAFCLYPEPAMRPFCSRFLSAPPPG
jgi:hypothetical protein